MGAAAQFPAHFVSDRAHVGSGGDAGAEADTVDLDCENFELLDLDLHWLQYDFFLLTRQLVGGNTFDFLGGERGRSLLDDPAESRGQRLDFFRLQA